MQETDTALDAARGRLAQVEALLADHAAEERARAELAAAEAGGHAARRASREAEAEVQAVAQKYQATQKRLYSGAVKNPKELQDMQAESAALTRRRAVLEDEQLEAMLAVDTAEAGIAQARAALSAAEAAHAILNTELQAEKAGLLAEVRKRETEHEAVEAQVGAEDRAAYARLRASKRGMAVSRLEEGACSACGVAPSAQRVASARSQNDLVRCGNCDRILYAL
ncbi:MAG: hypothetical protein HY784_17950 [Chloroflexi bacterium]|nr:hypothetical protein [Chloroflexota bacterium]